MFRKLSLLVLVAALATASMAAADASWDEEGSTASYTRRQLTGTPGAYNPPPAKKPSPPPPSAVCKAGAPANCRVCKNGNVCIACMTGWVLNSAGKCMCKTANCAACTATQCTQCVAGYTLSGNPTMCKICGNAVPNCATCTKTGKCDVCKAGFRKTSAGFCQACTAVTPNCAACDAAGCTKCKPGFNLLASSNILYKLFAAAAGKVCKACSQTAGPNCVTCFPNGSCSKCKAGFYNIKNVCKTCAQAVPNCATCASSATDTWCKVCAKGWSSQDNGACKACSLVQPNCLDCNKNFCKVGGCKKGFKTVKGLCVKA